ncbi:MAG: T9SS type A sorting domain-containing protein [Gemmatimonadetes bacterium]|nr:T9SS type A sorting domain-containing protein [Gemmatimonadota bacterium]
MRALARIAFLSLLIGAHLPGAAPAVTTEHFESGHVHPVEMSPDGTKLFVVHTANHELAVFDLTGPTPVRIGKVEVGYEPVSVRARNDNEVWVASHVSDAINIVDVTTMSVVRSLLPGDQPTDIQFVESQNRAFVCVSQEDRIAVYDLTNLAAAPTYIALNHSDPRSLELSPDGSTLYVASLDSQNNTTVIPWDKVQARGGRPAPNPPIAVGLGPEPLVGLIVRHDGSNWVDETATTWNVPYTLTDHDVIEIDTATLAVGTAHQAVGTNLFNMAVDPVTGTLYVTNQESFNEIRFDPNLQGQFTQSRITTITPGGTVTPVHLNSHINYAVPAGDPVERSLSLALPLDVAISSTGAELYVAAMGSDKVGVLNNAGAVTRRIPVGTGPTGLALDEARNALYVVNRFDSDLSVVDLTDDSSFTIPLGYDPTGNVISAGRPFLYNAENFSAHGDVSCATCHLFAETDGIAWELGSPEGVFTPPPNQGGGALNGWHPIKGPMTTQTLKALGGTTPFHWRGDFAAFTDFQAAFTEVQGRATPISNGGMTNLQNFSLSMLASPSPQRNLDDSIPPVGFNGGDPVLGRQLFQTGALFAQIGVTNCVDCHFLTGHRGTIILPVNLEGNQDLDIPHLRNMHEKTRFTPDSTTSVRGFGFLHDGAFGDLFSYFDDFNVFTFNNDTEKIDVEAFMMTFDTGTHPAIGMQWTMDGSNGQARLDSLIIEDNQNEIGLIAKGRDLSGQHRGWVRLGGGNWAADRAAEPNLTTAALVAGAGPGTELTFTAVMHGEQVRLGTDRDEDGFLDRDELDVGADPDDPLSTPNSVVATPFSAGWAADRIWMSGSNPTGRESRIGFQINRTGPARLEVYDVMGRRVRTLMNAENQTVGQFEQVWDLRNSRGQRVSSGTYFVRLTTGAGQTGQRVVVLR